MLTHARCGMQDEEKEMREKTPKNLLREEGAQRVGSAENSILQAVEQLEKGEEVEKKGEMKKIERE